jgi:ABC-type multidrug transport system ATPase subunit
MIELRGFEIAGSHNFRLRVQELKLNSGQFIQIYGNNNSGKSILLKTLAGYYPNYSGDLFYNGIPEKPGNYSVILINDYLAGFTRQSVRYNLYLPLGRISGRKKEKLQELLNQAGLNELLDKKYGSLSRSEGKSIELIRAIIQQPHFLLFDDFETYFDNTSLNNLTGAFDYAAKAGTALVITGRKKFEGVTNSYIINAGDVVKL